MKCNTRVYYSSGRICPRPSRTVSHERLVKIAQDTQKPKGGGEGEGEGSVPCLYMLSTNDKNASIP